MFAAGRFRAGAAGLLVIVAAALAAGLLRGVELAGEVVAAGGEAPRLPDLFHFVAQVTVLHLPLGVAAALLLGPLLFLLPRGRAGGAGAAWGVFFWFLVGGVAADDLALSDPLGAAHLAVRFAVLVGAVAVGHWRGWGGGTRCVGAGARGGWLAVWVVTALLALPLSGAWVRASLPAAMTPGQRIAGGGEAAGGEAARGTEVEGGGEVRPDLLLILVDTLRADHLGCYGYEVRPTTPTLDSLAAGGACFEHAYAQWTRTAPSHATIFSGLYPHDHALLANGSVLSREPRLLAEALRDAGYQTVGFVSNPFIGRRYGFDRGFQVYVETADFSLAGAPPAAWLRRLPLVRFWDRRRDQEPVSKMAVQWLERHPAGGEWGGKKEGHEGQKPVALVVQWVDPHMPYLPPRRWRNAFAGNYSGDLRGTRAQIDAINAGTLTVDAADIDHMVALYDAEIRNTDEGIRQVLDAWRRNRGARPTLVAMTADHGENMAEHEEWFRHPPEVYESAAHIPWILSGQARLGSIPPGVRVREPVAHLSFAATLLDLLGIEARLGRGGESVAPLVAETAVVRALGDGAPSPERFAIIEAAHGSERSVALVSGDRWKLRRSVTPQGTEETLWNLDADPGERSPSAAPAIKHRLALQLDAWFATQDSAATALLLQSQPLPADRLDEGTIRALRALGYL